MIKDILTWTPEFMNLTSQAFFWFLIASCIVYYSAGRRLQRYILLCASLFFYLTAASVKLYKLAVVVGFVVGVTYFGSLLIDRSRGKARTVLTWLSVSALVSALVVFKSAYNILSLVVSDPYRIEFLKFFPLIGLSYYTLSAIGYILDVSWGIYPAEKSLVNVALYVCFFPQLVSGPVTRYSQMREQFSSYHPLEYENIANGLRRMLWGYVKKLVISERFGVIVSAVYGEYSSYNGAYLVFATLCYAVQLYTDCSGCMDIIMGAAELFGFSLPENFDAPFFSLSLKEFWRRWHISLGTWFKDYVMYPVQMSGFMNKLGKSCVKVFGKKRGKKIPFYLSMFVLWVLIGLWHGGTAHYFIASGMIPFALLTLSDMMPSWFALKGGNAVSRVVMRVRTVLLMCVSFVFICAGSVRGAVDVYGRIFLHFLEVNTARTVVWEMVSVLDAVLMLSGLVLVLSADGLKNSGKSLSGIVDRQRAIVQYGVYYAGVLAVMFFGMVGNSSFIYFQF